MVVFLANWNRDKNGLLCSRRGPLLVFGYPIPAVLPDRSRDRHWAVLPETSVEDKNQPLLR
jgi:hypothetical protein